MTIHHHNHSFMTIHDFHDHSHIGWDNSLKPIAEVDSGQVVSFEIVEASGGQFTRHSTVEDVKSLDFGKVNPTVGPLYMKGAQPGDTLEVEMLNFEHLDWGWTAIIPAFRLLGNEFTSLDITMFDLKNRKTTEVLAGIQLSTKPIPGTICVGFPEEGRFNGVPPRKNGGYMDIRHLTKGAKLYLPVWVEGALFSIGDTHAAQGDGEVCGTAIVASMETTVRIRLYKGKTFLYAS